MEKIIINKTNNQTQQGNNNLQDIRNGKFFGMFLDSQKVNENKPKGLTNEGAMKFTEETVDILKHCNPHDATDKQETTHLVVGYVQSGKTMSFTGLTALALDNGYRIIIYLAGTKNNLLDQTTRRLKKDLIAGRKRNNNYYKIHPNPGVNDSDDIIGHIKSSDSPIILIPILKHYSHIDQLTEIFKKSEFQDILNNETAIIIDDEADQASLNNFSRTNSQKNEDEKSSTYEAILKLRDVLPGNTYIQYTATPQANILISMEDLLSPKSHTLLTPGKDYIGGKLFFGKGKNNELFSGGLIKTIPDQEVFHKKRNILKAMPQSLIDALILHILAVAIVVLWQQSEDITFLSMMVHVDNEKKWNKQFKDWIDQKLNSWRQVMDKEDGYDEKIYFLNRCKKLFPEAIRYYDENERPTFEDIKPLISDVLNDKKVYLVNTDKDAETEIEWDNYKMHVLVGAEMLNRGFTIENLTTTYMPRYTVSATNADTIQQRCRFFGYKKDYIRSCRVFLPTISIDNYKEYVDHEEELRCMLETCDNLEAAERRILLSPSLRPTRRNVLPLWVVNDRLKGMYVLQAFSSRVSIERNNDIVKEFLEKHNDEFVEDHSYTTLDRTHRHLKLKIDEAIELLSDFNFKNWSDAQRKANTIRYLRFLSSDEQASPIKYVYFYQMAFNAGPREREFNMETHKIASGLLAGPSRVTDATNYPGDRGIVGGEDTLTIQLHHIKFKHASIDFPKTAYTLAIYYPEQLAISYYSNEKNVIDDDDIDEESEN